MEQSAVQRVHVEPITYVCRYSYSLRRSSYVHVVHNWSYRWRSTLQAHAADWIYEYMPCRSRSLLAREVLLVENVRSRVESKMPPHPADMMHKRPASLV